MDKFKVKKRYGDRKVYECKFIVAEGNAVLLIDSTLKHTERLPLNEVDIYKIDKEGQLSELQKIDKLLNMENEFHDFS